MFAFPLIAYSVTGSTVATGIVGLIQGIGLLVGMLPGGVIADRMDRRKLRMLSGALGVMVQILLVVALVLGIADLWVLASLAAADRFRSSLLGSASNAMLKQLVPARQLPAAMSVNEGRDAAIEIGAGPVGAALLAWHLVAPILAQAVGSLVNLICTLSMRGDYSPREVDAGPSSVLRDLVDGLQWMLGQPVRIQIALAAALVNLGSNGALLGMTLHLASQGVPAVKIGLLNTAFAVAILAGSLVAPRLVASVPTGLLTIVQLGVIATVLALLPLLPDLWMVAGAYAVIGIGLAPLNASIMGFFLHITPRHMLGRAGAMTGLLAMGMMPLAPAVAGWGLEHWGTVATLLVFAGVCVGGALVFLMGGPARQIPASVRWEEYARAQGMVEPTGA